MDNAHHTLPVGRSILFGNQAPLLPALAENEADPIHVYSSGTFEALWGRFAEEIQRSKCVACHTDRRASFTAIFPLSVLFRDFKYDFDPAVPSPRCYRKQVVT